MDLSMLFYDLRDSETGHIEDTEAAMRPRGHKAEAWAGLDTRSRHIIAVESHLEFLLNKN